MQPCNQLCRVRGLQNHISGARVGVCSSAGALRHAARPLLESRSKFTRFQWRPGDAAVRADGLGVCFELHLIVKWTSLVACIVLLAGDVAAFCREHSWWAWRYTDLGLNTLFVALWFCLSIFLLLASNQDDPVARHQAPASPAAILLCSLFAGIFWVRVPCVLLTLGALVLIFVLLLPAALAHRGRRRWRYRAALHWRWVVPHGFPPTPPHPSLFFLHFRSFFVRPTV